METTQNIISTFEQTNHISIADIELIAYNSVLRRNLIQYIQQNPNRIFAKTLLSKAMDCRQGDNTYSNEVGSGDNLMFACYLLGLHQQVEDCLLIWEVKNIDFDAFCYIDTQLVLFAGLDKTIQYLQSSNLSIAQKAWEHIQKYPVEDVDIEAYFSLDNLPFYI